MAKLEKKIFLDKNDDLDKAVGQLVAAEAEKVILNIPKSSVLAVSVHNFQVLERESETAGKELAIESVDEHVLELASLATIPAVNPVFKVRERAAADILLAESEEPEVEEKPAKKPRVKKTKAKAEKPESTVREKPKRAGRKRKEPVEKIIPIIVKEKEKPAVPETFEEVIPKHEFKYEERKEKPEERPVHRKPKRGRRFWITAVSVPVVLAAAYFVAADLLPMVAINISIQKTTAPFSMNVVVDKNTNVPSVNNNVVNLPGQLTVAKNNLSMSFPATGSSTVSTKAGGTMTVHNDYTQNQTLVATTRFELPDGKIFRLVKQASIPKGKSVDVQVVADQAGSDYNVPPASHWNIPGFKGKPQYDKIYGESKTSMTGGASGNQTIPTPQDITQGKTKIESALSDSLKSQTLILSSQDLKLLNNASAFNVTTENISGQVDKDGNFSIYAAGELRQLVFDESMLKNVIVGAVAISTVTSTTDVKIDNFSKNYSTSTADLVNGKLTFSVNGTVTYEPKIDFDAFKKNIAGLDADSLKTAIFALPGLQKANISFWPFWVNSVPARETRVNMVVE